MAVVARLKVQQVTLTGYATGVKLTQVGQPPAGDPHKEEIEAFHAATPVATFEAQIKNELAAEQFQPGDEFYLSLEKIPARAESEPATVA
jgi:hypothetical protein